METLLGDHVRNFSVGTWINTPMNLENQSQATWAQLNATTCGRTRQYLSLPSSKNYNIWRYAMMRGVKSEMFLFYSSLDEERARPNHQFPTLTPRKSNVMKLWLIDLWCMIVRSFVLFLLRTNQPEQDTFLIRTYLPIKTCKGKRPSL